MLLDLKDLVEKYDLKIRGIIHAGAHLGEEAQDYLDLRVHNVWWIEGNPFVMGKLSKHLRQFPSHHLLEALLADEDGKEMAFNITNYDGMSSSIYEFGTHVKSSPDTNFVNRVNLLSKTLDALVREHKIEDVNFLNMDLQGAELLALRGATDLLPKIDYIYTEVNIEQVYVGCAQMSELDELLCDFNRVETSMTPAGWGDALYVRA